MIHLLEIMFQVVTGDTIAEFGGTAAHSSLDGLGAVYAAGPSSSSGVRVGSGVCF